MLGGSGVLGWGGVIITFLTIAHMPDATEGSTC